MPLPEPSTGAAKAAGGPGTAEEAGEPGAAMAATDVEAAGTSAAAEVAAAAADAAGALLRLRPWTPTCAGGTAEAMTAAMTAGYLL